MPDKVLPIALRALAIFAVSLLVTSSSWAATKWSAKVLHNFGNPPDGVEPWAGLIPDAAGNFYGTTVYGGTYGYGTVYELSPAQGGGWTERVLHSFNNNGADGWYPSRNGLTIDAAGNLYGTTQYGPGYGAVFELSPSGGGGWNEKVLYSFGGNGDGRYPNGGLVFDTAGNIYGATDNGGIYCDQFQGCGTVFELSPAPGGGWTEQVLHSFNDEDTNGVNPLDGLILDAAGNLYGTTSGGGTHNPGGTVFELSPNGDGSWRQTVLYRFGPAPDGTEPWAGLIFDAVGNLYGTTRTGGANNVGTLFELSPNGSGGWTETVLHSFGNGTDGYQPLDGSLIFDAEGNLYGTTQEGGNEGGGIVFEFSPNGSGGWTETILHSFDNAADGYWPFAGMTFDAAGNLYGTVYQGGTYGVGGVFQLTPIHACIKCSHAGRR